MKKYLFSLIFLLVSYIGFSQKGLSYQAVILDPAKIEIPGEDISSQPLVNGDVWMKFSIYNGSTLQFEEVHKTKTDNYGLVNLLIGSVSSTSFNSLVWDGSQKSLQVFVSFNQGSSYTKISDQKLNYNPYALFAETAGKLSGVLPVANGGTGATTAADARANLGLDQVNNTSDAAKPVSTATRAALDLKANASDVTAGLALKANASDMSTSLAAKADTGTIKTFVVTQVAAATIADADANIKGKIKIAGDLAGTADVPTVPGLALKANTSDVVAALNLKANSVDITNALALKANGANVSASLNLKENSANKSLNVNTDGSSDIKYPSAKAVKDYVDARVQSGGGSTTITDADATTKGKIKLAGDLGGTADAPTVPGLTLKANAADLATLTSSVNTNTASITANTNNIATLNANLATNTATMNAISSNFATLNADVVSNTSITTSNTTAITAEATRATAIELILTNSVASNTASITTNIADITTLNTNVASNTASITANATAITAEATRATAAELVLTNNVSANTSSITANSSDIALKAPIASPTFTGTPAAPTATAGTSTTQLATTEFVMSARVNSSSISGTVAVANGGTGTTTAPTQGGIIYATNTSAFASTAAGTTGQVLTSNGTSAPTWGSSLASLGTQTKNTVLAGPSSNLVTLVTYDGSSTSGFTIGSGVTIDNTIGNPGSSFKNAGQNYMYKDFGQNFKNKIIEFDIRLAANSTGGFVIGNQSNGSNGVGLRISSGTNNNNGFRNNDTWSYPPIGFDVLTIAANTWHSVKIVTDNGTQGGTTWYLDGTYVGNSGTHILGNGTYFGFTSDYSQTLVYFDNITIKDNSGLGATPSFRALVADDIPTLNQSTTGNAATATSATSFTGNLSGDVTGTQSSTVVGKINGTSLAGLSTGILKNTTSTGVPTIAVAGTDYQLPITITTTGTGAATLSGTTLNIPTVASAVNASTISGTLAVANGGTGVTTLTGLVKGNGTSAMTTAVAGTDYVAPSGTFYVGTTQIAHNRSSAAQTLTGVSIDGNAATATTASSAGYATTANSANSATSATTALNFTGSLVGDVSGTQGATVIGIGKVTNTMLAGGITVAKGGTGATTLTGLVKGNGTNAMTAAVAGTDYQAPITLTTTGTGAATLSGTTLNIPSITGGVSSLTYTTVTSYASGGTISGTSLTLAAADGSNPGLISTDAQTIAGAKTFTGAVTTPIYASTPQVLTDAATISWNPTLGLNASVTLGGDRTLSFSSNPLAGSYGTLVITQDVTGGRNITLPSTANKILGSTSTTTIALSSTGGAKDILNFYYDGINCFWSVGQGYGQSITNSSTNLATGVTGTLPVANGGTGLTTTPANGQIDIGNGTGFTRSTLTAGTGISITNATGTITIASSGGSGVPYTGATSAVDLGAYDLTVNGLTIGKGKNNNNTNTAVGYNVIAGANYAGGGNRNTAVGSLAGQYLKDGADNSAFGYKALSGTGTPNQLYGNYNTAIGSYALSNIGENISFNTAVGSNALPSTTSGIRNTSIGYNSGISNTTANDNTFLGANTAVSTNTLTNVTAIGSGATVSSSNTIKLGNASITSVTTSGALTTGAVTYPIAHGTANQILTTTGSGTLTWTTPSTTATSYSGTLPVANGGTGVTSSTGTGNVVLSASPTLTGTPIAPTATAGDNSTQIATTAFVTAAVASSSGGSGNITYTTGLNNDLGGYVIYVTPNGKHGLVVETYEFPSTLYLANDYLKDPTYHSVAGKNFMDWRVPTQYELDLMFTKKVVLGLSNSDVYWSSTNIPASPGDLGSYYCRYSGGGFPDPFESEHFIRAVRSF